jgi:hypothetical protein
LITRFALVHSDTGQVETGANYPGCSQSNPQACDPQSFASMADAQAYANGKGEQIYVVGAALPNSPQWTALSNQVWQYVSNPASLPPPPAAGGSDLLLIGGVALAAYLLL